MQSDHQPKGPKEFYFLDQTKHESDSDSVTGAQVRAQLPADRAGYAILLESQGNDPDIQVTDSAVFSLSKKPLHFYSVPPATFGLQ